MSQLKELLTLMKGKDLEKRGIRDVIKKMEQQGVDPRAVLLFREDKDLRLLVSDRIQAHISNDESKKAEVEERLKKLTPAQRIACEVILLEALESGLRRKNH